MAKDSDALNAPEAEQDAGGEQESGAGYGNNAGEAGAKADIDAKREAKQDGR